MTDVSTHSPASRQPGLLEGFQEGLNLILVFAGLGVLTLAVFGLLGLLVTSL